MKPTIKVLAREAKQRMCEGQSPENRSMLADAVREEERVYRLVSRMMLSDEIVLDPIARVAQPALWRTLQGVERERYVLNLSAVYLKMLARYAAEHPLTAVGHDSDAN